MDLNTITISDFKAQFVRDFPYLPVWDVSTTYNTNAIVYYEVNELFYKCLENGVTEVPTDATKWELYTDSTDNYVLDADITRAFGEAQVVFNQGLFSTDANITLAYLYVTAHYLVMDIRMANGGLQSTGEFSVQSRSVGSVSESYGIPQAYLDSPIYNYYTKTGYGLKYLSLVLPKLIGNVVTVCGGTRP